MDEQLPKTYRDILNNDDGVILERADLPSWLRFLPPGKALTRNSKISSLGRTPEALLSVLPHQGVGQRRTA